jgi:outer membrane murein-binding lipoprotein Lpp
MASDPYPPSNPNVPWWSDGRTVLLALGMAFGFALNFQQGCQNGQKINTVQAQADTLQAHQAANSVKLDDAARHAERAAAKADVLERKTDAIVGKVGADRTDNFRDQRPRQTDKVDRDK